METNETLVQEASAVIETPAIREYQLTVRVSFSALDDIEARQKSQELLKGMTVPEGTVKKLQRVQAGKQPEGVRLE
jgi:hypothetical protein